MVANNDPPEKSFSEMSADDLNKWFDRRFDERMRKQEESRTPRLSIMVTKGTLD